MGGAMIRVLLADDDQPFLDALSPLIERQPELRSSGRPRRLAAIELADELSPDAVVIDLHMPRSTASARSRGCAATIRACA
jgi:DNA-binding NarL/FixJ family response regulator